MRNALVALGVLGALCYFNGVGNPFVHDDVVFILENPQVRHLSRVLDVFEKSSFAPSSIAVANAYYRPFLEVVYRIEYALFGPVPVGYHVVNVLLHVGNGFLLFILTLRLTRRQGLAFCMAVLFLVHPIQSEAVACISGISNLLFSFFLLAAFLFYIKIAKRDEEMSAAKEAGFYSAALFLFGGALLCKEQAIILPFLLLLYESCFPEAVKKGSAGWRLRLAGFVIVTGGYFLWREIVIGGSLPAFVANWGELYLRIKSFSGIILNHWRTVVWPMDLHYYRSYNILSPWVWPAVVFILLILGGILLWRILPRNRQPLFAFGAGWFAITILPTTSIVPLVHEYSFIAAFEHFLYLPLAGILWSALVALDYASDLVLRKQSVLTKKVFVGVVVTVCVMLTYGQTPMWAGEIPLFKKAVRYENKMGRLHLLLARAYYNNRDYGQASREYAIGGDIMAQYLGKIRDERVRPFYEGFLRDSWLGLAACAEATGHLDDGQMYYEKILRFSPHDSLVENHLGFIAVRLEQWDAARSHFERALEFDPRNAEIMTNAGVCYIYAGQLDKAEKYFRRAVAVDPNLLSAKKNLEQLLKQKSLGKKE